MPRVLLVALLLMGCRNECQQICADMSDLAEECGEEWEKEHLKQCFEAYSGKNVGKNQREYCSIVRPGLDEEWTCEEIEAYFDAGGASAD